jgi:Mn2+/Fe2+ NRAMP family transporter
VTAVAYGITSPILIAVILHICNNKKIMGHHTNGWRSNLIGVLTLFFMLAAVVLLLVV